MTTSENKPLSGKKARARDAFASILAQIRAVEESNYKDITVDVRAAVTTATRAWPHIRLLRSRFATELPRFPISQFDNLETYALALGHAQALYERAIVIPASLVELAYRAVKTRDIVLAELNSIDGPKRTWCPIFAETHDTKGYKNIAKEVRILLLFLSSRLLKGSSLTGISIEDMDQAEALAKQLEAATVQHQRRPVVPKQVDCDLRAAFTLFINAYQRVRVAIAYLRFDEDDAAVIAPPLRMLRFARDDEPTQDAGATPCRPSVPDSLVQSASPSIDIPLPLTGWSDPAKRSPFRA